MTLLGIFMTYKYHDLDTNNDNVVLTLQQIDRILGRSVDGRKSYIKRAVKDGYLIRIKRGLYIKSYNYKPYDAHPFYIAQALSPGSYISMESALSYYGWIPEAVYSTTSVTCGRETFELNHDIIGYFSFHTLAINQFGFLEAVNRQKENNQTWLMASPFRALMDLVAYKKIEWQGLAWLIDGLRIDFENLISIKEQQFDVLKNVYKHKRANDFLTKFEHAICEAKGRYD